MKASIVIGGLLVLHSTSFVSTPLKCLGNNSRIWREHSDRT